MEVKVLTMTGGEYVFADVMTCEYIEGSTILSVSFLEDGESKVKHFPVVNLESVEKNGE